MKNTHRMCKSVVSAVAEYVVVDDTLVLEKTLCGILGGGHVLFEDNPGLGKTMLVKAFARVMGCEWKRIQFTPDLMPADILGTSIWKASLGAFELEKGPVFTNLLLADEINRAMPKTQSALLEAMEERQVTIEGSTHILTPPFTVLATQNPIDNEGTYSLPEAQLDRFMLKLSLGYLSSAEREAEILRRRVSWKQDDPTRSISPTIDQTQLVELQQAVESIYVDENIVTYITNIVRATRADERVAVGSSPRGALALLKVSRALALVQGRDYVVPDDVKEMAVSALAHRVILHMDYAIEGVDPKTVIEEVVESVSVPKDFRPR